MPTNTSYFVINRNNKLFISKRYSLNMSSSRPELYRRQAERNSAENSINRFPSKPFPHSMLLVFKKFDYNTGYGNSEYTNGLLQAGLSQYDLRSGRNSGVNVREMDSVELPFPKQLQDSTNIMLNGFSRDPLVEKLTTALTSNVGGDDVTLGDLPAKIQGAGAALAAAMATSGGGAGGIKASIAKVLQDVGGIGVNETAQATKYILSKAAPLLGDIGNSINLATGSIINPKETLAFEGVQLRSHSFSWDLYPNNREDSAQIKKIIAILKKSVLPETESFSLSGVNFDRAFLKFPRVCYPYLIGIDEDAYMKFKPCLVQNMTVDYGAGGNLAIMAGGKPAGVTISMTLQELAIETADDYIADKSAATDFADANPPTPPEEQQGPF